MQAQQIHAHLAQLELLNFSAGGHGEGVHQQHIAGRLLKEAKEFVESAPKTIKEAASKEECEKIKAKLAEVGATVEIK